MKNLFVLAFILAISCSRKETEDKLNTPSHTPFYKARIVLDVGACPCCGSGYWVTRLDSLINFHADSVPPNAGGIGVSPDTFFIRYRITGNWCGAASTIKKITIDSLRR